MIPTYNQSKYIERSIQSAVEQSYGNIEIIVSDDSTDDLTQNIVMNRFGKNIKYIHNKEARGRVGNYHFLLYELAKGDWVINLDGDDYFTDKEFIKKAIEEIKKHEDLVLVFAKQTIYKEATDQEHNYSNKHLDTGVLLGDSVFLDSIYKNIEIPHLTSLYNRKKALEVGFYDADIISADRKSLLKLLLNHKVFFLNRFVAVWNHHGSNASQTIMVDDFFINLKMYDELYTFAKEHSSIPRYRLWFWKIVAKYKSIYGYLTKLIILKEMSSIKIFMKKVALKNFSFLLPIILDLRIYKKVLLK